MMATRWSGFADLAFATSAWIAFARAAELAETDAHEHHPEAWIIHDQRITFSLEATSGRAQIEGMKRFLSLLAMQAESGEAVLEVDAPSERWVRRAATPSISKELSLVADDAEHPVTIRANSA
jgi:hypothetical protein